MSARLMPVCGRANTMLSILTVSTRPSALMGSPVNGDTRRWWWAAGLIGEGLIDGSGCTGRLGELFPTSATPSAVPTTTTTAVTAARMCSRVHRIIARASLRGPRPVDLVEVAEAVPAAAAARPLPHQGVLTRAADTTEKPSTCPGSGQAPARRVMPETAGEGRVRPFVGVRQRGGVSGAHDGGPDARRRVDARLELRVRGQVVGEAVEGGPVDVGRD